MQLELANMALGLLAAAAIYQSFRLRRDLHVQQRHHEAFQNKVLWLLDDLEKRIMECERHHTQS